MFSPLAGDVGLFAKGTPMIAILRDALERIRDHDPIGQPPGSYYCPWCSEQNGGDGLGHSKDCPKFVAADALRDFDAAVDDAVENTVLAIIKDISGRKGLGDEWDNIDGDVQAEIQQAWEEVVNAHLRGAR